MLAGKALFGPQLLGNDLGTQPLINPLDQRAMARLALLSLRRPPSPLERCQ